MYASAIVLAAGKGTRMRSDLPKVLHLFRGQPLVLHPLKTALVAGLAPVVTVLGHGGDQVQSSILTTLGEHGSDLRFARQEQQKGTGHAVLSALPALDDCTGVVIVLSGDVPLVQQATLTALYAGCVASPAKAAVATFIPADPKGYGRILRDDGGHIVGICEQRDGTPTQLAIRECNAGIYAFDLAVLRQELPRLGGDNAQGEIYLTDLIARRAVHGEIPWVSVNPVEAAGVNSPEDLTALEALAESSGL